MSHPQLLALSPVTRRAARRSHLRSAAARQALFAESAWMAENHPISTGIPRRHDASRLVDSPCNSQSCCRRIAPRRSGVRVPSSIGSPWNLRGLAVARARAGEGRWSTFGQPASPGRARACSASARRDVARRSTPPSSSNAGGIPCQEEPSWDPRAATAAFALGAASTCNPTASTRSAAGRLRFRTVGSEIGEARRQRAALIAAVRCGVVPVSPRLHFDTVAG